ncbi:MAG: carbonate dehydratase [Bacteroidota bacterium]|nr:carbonate dehydratase [Bacteroidota bacterium]MDX5430262.1 carbonate dehydratase [Bacteroidota bacterium]MDX5469023.1 carbonate dehydratase [Bacteroidota bacterium]
MKSYEQLLLANKAWATEKSETNPDFFPNLAKGQHPRFLWIGCSDSRVPADMITGTEPGEIFVHRNVANMVVHTDLNMLSVLQYAVEVLKVEHVMVVGHYGCGGVLASMKPAHLGLINKWLRNIKEVYRIHQDQLDEIQDFEKKGDKLVEYNVIEQVYNLAKTSIIQRAWKKGQPLVIHGWVYGMNDGIIKDLIRMENMDDLDPIFQFTFEGDTER